MSCFWISDRKAVDDCEYIYRVLKRGAVFNQHVKWCCEWLGNSRLLTASRSDRVVLIGPKTKDNLVRGPRLGMLLKISLANFIYFKLISIKFEIRGFRSDS